MKTGKPLAIVTVVFQNYTILPDFFDSLAKQTDTHFHVYLLDLTPDAKIPSSYPPFVTYMSDKNKGYAYGINHGIKKALSAGEELVCVINSDVTVGERFVENVKTSISQNPSSLIGGKIYYYPGFEYHTKKYTKEDLGHVLWYAGGYNDWNNCYTNHRGVDEVDKGQFDNVEETDFITGCLMCFDKSLIERVGYFDESYFLYYEDADYCERVKRAGEKLIFDPSIVLWHKNGQSTEGSGSALHVQYQKKNQLIYGLKYAPLKTKLHLLKNFFFRK